MAVKRLALIVAMLFIPALAKADSVWTYQGNVNGNGPAGQGEGFALIGTVLLNNDDQAVAWNFIGGPAQFTNFNSTGTIDPFACSRSQVPFATWNIILYTNSGAVGGRPAVLGSSKYGPGRGSSDDVSDFNGGLLVFELGNPGTWTEVVSTPEPGSLLLLGAGLGALALALLRLDRLSLTRVA